MKNNVKYFCINSYEQMEPFGDYFQMLVFYSIADDDQGIHNRKDLKVVVQSTGTLNCQINEKIISEKITTKLDDVICLHVREKIKNTLRIGNQPETLVRFTPYDDIQTNLNNIELRIGEWEEIIIERKMGFNTPKNETK